MPSATPCPTRAASATWIDVLGSHARVQPDAEAYRFFHDDASVAITYRALEERARSVAARLQQTCSAGDRVLLLCPPGLDYITAFLGCLCAGVIAVPAYPPRAHRGLDRIEAIQQDAAARVALTVSALVPRLGRANDSRPDWPRLEAIPVDAIPSALAEEWQPVRVTAETPAFLQYTSGSTGTPRGVVVTHGNLLHNAGLTCDAMRHGPSSVFLSWLPMYHDMGLIAGVLQPLFGGFRGLLMAPASFLQRPARWLELIAAHKVTTSGGPNFAYDLCVRKIGPELRAGLDLRSWTVAFNGAEPIRADTLTRFADAFRECGFREQAFFPCYGLAEGTLQVTGPARGEGATFLTVWTEALHRHLVIPASHGDPRGLTLVSSGRACGDLRVAIVDPETHALCAEDRVGEIWVSGPSVARGYWNRPADTAHVFHATLDGDRAPRYLRTGDLGFVREGQVFVTGRLKDLIIIRGLNHYPQDIEQTMEASHPAVRAGCGAAFSVDINQVERLAVVQELEFRYRGEPAEVIAAIRAAIAEQHGLQAHVVVLVEAGTIRKTSSGKIQRAATREDYLRGALRAIASSALDLPDDAGALAALTRDVLLALDPEDREGTIARTMRDEISRVLHVAPASLFADEALGTYGLDSLGGLELKFQLECVLGIHWPDTGGWDTITLRQLVAFAMHALLEPLPLETTVA